MVVTRIAPSPTGKFHIGTARTALFSYLFARQNKGKFYLRIEDTDQARSSNEHIADIKESLDWLGLKWDNKASEHCQSKRLGEYCRVAQELTDKGFAYKKDGAVYFNVKFLISQPEAGPPWADNFKTNPKTQNPKKKTPKSQIPKPENLIFTDLVHGTMSFGAKDIEDFVILKSDGWPTFHLAVVVDDHDMGVTHIIRGDDHLSNTPKHILLYRAMAWAAPAYAHLPLILNANRTKMSKRRDPVSVSDDFKSQGFLPEAMVNYLALLGWNPKTEEEFFSLQELVNRFDIKGVQKSNAVFDSGRLRFFNAHYLRQKPIGDIVDIAKPLWRENYDISAYNKDYLEKVAKLVVERCDTIAELVRDVDFFFTEPKLDRGAIAFKKSTAEATSKGLTKSLEALGALETNGWEDTTRLNNILSKVVAQNNLSNGDVFWSVRYALTGALASPKPEELLTVLGKTKSLKRLEAARDKLKVRG